MGLIIGFCKLIIRLILSLAVLIAFILLIPNLPPYTKFTSIKIEPTQQRTGGLAPNDVLNNVKHLYKDKLLGPECFQELNDEVYTGLATGEIVKLSRGGHVTFVTKIGQPCTGLTQEHICGRALGFVIDEKNKDLIVADAYHGIWKVNLKTDKKQLLVSPRVAIDGKVPMIFNGVALANNGDIYWTHSSSEFHLKDGVFAVLSDPSARLLYYNAAKNESKVLVDNLWFANGLAVSPDNQFVIVAETNKYQIIKYYTNGPKKGQSEIFVTGLPGLPDNIRVLPDGSGVLVALYSVFDDDNPSISKSMSEAPLARKFIARLFRLMEIPFEFLQTHFHNHVFESILHYIGSFGSAAALSSGMSGLVQIDWNGNIVASYYNTDGSIIHLSDVIVVNDQLYTACPHLQDFVGAVPAPPALKKAFAKTTKQQPKVETKREEQKKPAVKEPKEVPKTVKPVQKAQPPKADKPIEKNQDSKQASQTKPPPPPPAKQPSPPPATQPPPPPPAKQQPPPPAKPEIKNTIPKESKPKVTTKQEKDSKPDVKPKVVPKDDTKPKSKETAAKPKEEPKATETKPKVATKEEAPKQKAPAEKPKPQEAQKVDKQPVVKETNQADKTKPKMANVKPTNDKETVSKSDKKPEKPQVKPVKVSESAKPAAKAEAKASESKPQPKPKKVEEETRKAIPIEEEIPSDTRKPSEEKLKVIKKGGPQEIPNPNL